MLIWQRWNLSFTSAEGFWGSWEHPLPAPDLQDGCYWVVPTHKCSPLIAGFIDELAVSTPDQIDCYKPEPHIDETVVWYLVRSGEAHLIGRWGFKPGFLDPEPPAAQYFEVEDVELNIL
jgi:hypothetical protein